MAAQLHYLTVQDILWINMQVTDKVQPFSFAKLEEATYYQYAYGESRSLVPQAARFLIGFPKLSPIGAGNDATTFLAVLTFLAINGMEINLKDELAVEWYRSVQTRAVMPGEAINSVARPTHGSHGSPDIRIAVKDLLARFPGAVSSLAGE